MKFKINNKNITNITKKYIQVGSYLVNGEQFYTLVLNLEFEYNNKKGYLSLAIGKEEQNDISLFKNKTYNTTNVILEIFDTDKFYDLTFSPDLLLKTGIIKDNKLQILLTSNDEECIVEYEDEVEVKKN